MKLEFSCNFDFAMLRCTTPRCTLKLYHLGPHGDGSSSAPSKRRCGPPRPHAGSSSPLELSAASCAALVGRAMDEHYLNVTISCEELEELVGKDEAETLRALRELHGVVAPQLVVLREGTSLQEHNDTCRHTIIVLLTPPDKFDGGCFQYRDGGTWVSRPRVQGCGFAIGPDVPHRVSEVTAGTRVSLVLQYGAWEERPVEETINSDNADWQIVLDALLTNDTCSAEELAAQSSAMERLYDAIIAYAARRGWRGPPADEPVVRDFGEVSRRLVKVMGTDAAKANWAAAIGCMAAATCVDALAVAAAEAGGVVEAAVKLAAGTECPQTRHDAVHVLANLADDLERDDDTATEGVGTINFASELMAAGAVPVLVEALVMPDKERNGLAKVAARGLRLVCVEATEAREKGQLAALEAAFAATPPKILRAHRDLASAMRKCREARASLARAASRAALRGPTMPPVPPGPPPPAPGAPAAPAAPPAPLASQMTLVTQPAPQPLASPPPPEPPPPRLESVPTKFSICCEATPLRIWAKFCNKCGGPQ